MLFRPRHSLATILLLLAAFALPRPAFAGGGPENLFLVVNAQDSASLAVANRYIQLRHIPTLNVLHMPWDIVVSSIDADTFRDKLLRVVLQAISDRGLASQIDYIVYSASFPTKIDFNLDVPEKYRNPLFCGSLTGMTYLHEAVLARQPQAFMDLGVNHYMRSGENSATHGFRAWYGWDAKGRLLESGGNHYMLSTMLAVSGPRGNTADEAANYLRRAAGADGTHPPGTIYYMRNGDIRSTTRDQNKAFETAIASLHELGVAGEIVDGVVPVGKTDVQGLMTGIASFSWAGSKSTILPGAICENFTSFGAVFEAGNSQTTLAELLRYGAAGSSGTVVEPYAIQAKFPVPAIQVHYARGCSLAESFYQAVHAPLQLLIVGDPLCRPWASIPKVKLAGVSAGETIRGKIEIKPSATVAEVHLSEGHAIAGPAVDRFELYVNGLLQAHCSTGGTLSLDTTAQADGDSELRVVAIESGPIESQGETILNVNVANHDRSLACTVSAKRVRLGKSLQVTVKGTGLEWVAVFDNARLLGRVSGTSGTVTIDSTRLGQGPVLLRGVGKVAGAPVAGDSHMVFAKPVAVEITP